PTPTASIAAAPARRAPGLLRAGSLSILVAAVATTAVAAGARAADVPLTIEGEQIPVTGFAVMTVLWAGVGLLLAAAIRRWAPAPPTTFAWLATALVLVSFVPSLTADASTATKVVLVVTHVVAAVIVVPVVVRVLGEGREVAR
ncbi:MAG TPA: DUF6069 family protein, partial [Acidimicrobiales bacterium]